jgi:serine/threonine protein phosphatase 1
MAKPHERGALPRHVLPPDVIEWMLSAVLVRGRARDLRPRRIAKKDGKFPHPSECEPKTALLWTRTESFFREYRGKREVIGHTKTEQLPPELSDYTPDDPTDMWAGECVIALDTGCGSLGGFLTCVELPALRVYESRDPPP